MDETNIAKLLIGRHFGAGDGELYFCCLEPFLLYKDATETGLEDTIELKTSDWERYSNLSKQKREEYEHNLLNELNENYPPIEVEFWLRNVSLAKLCQYPNYLIFRDKDFSEFYAVMPDEEGKSFIAKLDPYANPHEVLPRFRNSRTLNVEYTCVKRFYKNIRKFFEIELEYYDGDRDIPLPKKFDEHRNERGNEYDSLSF